MGGQSRSCEDEANTLVRCLKASECVKSGKTITECAKLKQECKVRSCNDFFRCSKDMQSNVTCVLANMLNISISSQFTDASVHSSSQELHIAYQNCRRNQWDPRSRIHGISGK
jgi:hypothetical protein